MYGPQWTVYEPGLDYFVDKEREAIKKPSGGGVDGYKNSLQSIVPTATRHGRMAESGYRGVLPFLVFSSCLSKIRIMRI